MHMPPEGGTGAVGGTASVTVSSVKDVDLKKYVQKTICLVRKSNLCLPMLTIK